MMGCKQADEISLDSSAQVVDGRWCCGERGAEGGEQTVSDSRYSLVGPANAFWVLYDVAQCVVPSSCPRTA